MRRVPHGSGISNPDHEGLGMLMGAIAATWRRLCIVYAFPFLGLRCGPAEAGTEVLGELRDGVNAAVADRGNQRGTNDHAVRVSGDLADMVRGGDSESDTNTFGAGCMRVRHNLLRGA